MHDAALSVVKDNRTFYRATTTVKSKSLFDESSSGVEQMTVMFLSYYRVTHFVSAYFCTANEPSTKEQEQNSLH